MRVSGSMGWMGWLDVGFLDRSEPGGALWERFESAKKAQERNAGVEALGPGKNAVEEILGYTDINSRPKKKGCVEKDGTHTHDASMGLVYTYLYIYIILYFG